MAEITMKNIVKKYGDGFPAVNDVECPDVADGGVHRSWSALRLREVHAAVDDRRLEDITSGDMVIGGNSGSTTRPRATATCRWCSRTTPCIRT